MFSVIIPVKERNNNLDCVLKCLELQDFDKSKFEVIICDQGKSELAINIVNKYYEILDIKYYYQYMDFFGAGHLRNKGIAIAKYDNIIFLDSDIIFKKDWLSTYDKQHTEYPEAIIISRYDWMKPMNVNPDDIVNKFDEVITQSFPQTGEWIGGVHGDDPRITSGTFTAEDKVVPNLGYALGMFGGNILIPKKYLLEVGGFDENIKGHGGEDAELGLTFESKGFKAMFSEKTRGWHLNHYRDQEKNAAEVKINIDYIDRKHCLGVYGAEKKNNRIDYKDEKKRMW